MKTIGYTITFISLVLFGCIFSGFALSVLWGWFFVPILGAPQITVAGAIGIALVVGFLTHQDLPADEDREFGQIMLEGFFRALVKPSVVLLVGWIVSLWV